MLKKVKKYYDTFSSQYDTNRTGKYFSFINEMESQTVIRYGEDKKILEVGCGTGLILNKVNKLAKLSVGIDISEKMLNIASRKGLNITLADAVNLPFKDESFDITFSFKVLPHIPDIRRAISEITRVTKKKGLLILEFYNPLSIKYLINKITDKHVYQRFHSYCDIKKLLSPNLTIESIRGIRIFTIFGFLFKIPIFSDIITFLEKKFCDTKFGLFGGYFVIIIRKH